jgi:hypothetical protein
MKIMRSVVADGAVGNRSEIQSGVGLTHPSPGGRKPEARAPGIRTLSSQGTSSSGNGISDDVITTINPLIVASLATAGWVVAMPGFPWESGAPRHHLTRDETRVLSVGGRERSPGTL